MNRAMRVPLALVSLAVCLVAGCGGGSGTTSTPPPPAPQSNPVPTLSSINPATAVAGAADTTITLTGSGFISATTVKWNGSALATTFISAAQLKATVPAADFTGSAMAVITVSNPAPGGGDSAPASFAVNSPAPSIAAISPRYVAPGNAATITITGAGFESNSLAMWNGAARPTTFVSGTTLTVSLSAADLQNQGTGSLTVSNPAPAPAASGGATLTVTSVPVPVIQGATVTAGPGISGTCPALRVDLTGQNFGIASTVQANGASIAVVSIAPTSIHAELPAGFVAAPGALSFTVTNQTVPIITSDPFAYPAGSPPAMTVCASPFQPTVYAGSNFSIFAQPSEVNVSGNATLTLGTLPAGITWPPGSAALPPGGAAIHLQASNAAVAGSYDIVVNGSAGSVLGKGDFNFTLSTGTPEPFGFITPIQNEVGVPIGGSGSIQLQSFSAFGEDYDVTPSVSNLPPGTTATFTPNVFSVGQSVLVTLTAASNAPVTQNAVVTVTGTPQSATPSGSANFFADVTQPPGSLPGNRTDFVSMAGTPYAAVFDATHNLIFASNPAWNRVDVISNVTHKIVKQIPVRSPCGIDVTQDGAHVWVQTTSPHVYEIDTQTFQAKHYVLPNGPINSPGPAVSGPTCGLSRILALADGTLFVYFGEAGIWNPSNGQMKVLTSFPPTELGIPVRSGDGSHVYAPYSASGNFGMYVYTVNSQTLTAIGSITATDVVAAVNGDGSRVVLLRNFGILNLYDSNLNLIGMISGNGSGSSQFSGGAVFSADGSKIYEIEGYNGVAALLTIDSQSLKVLGVAPSSPGSPVGTSGVSGTAAPFAVDSTGIVLGKQSYGISFDDSTFFQNYAANQPGANGISEFIATYSGPLAGGTTSTINQFRSLQPDVWFGATRGTTSFSQGQLQFTSPPSQTPGPVNVKFIYPDGEQAFYAQLFGYSTFPQYALTSGSSPDGGAEGQIVGYGLPQDPSQGTVEVGGNNATITTTKGQYPPLSGEPFPSTVLKYTFPAGTPGFSDLQVSTPIGSGALPKAILYAKSVHDYSSGDAFNAVIYDGKRKQVYLSAGDHVDVFSLASQQFLTPLQPAANGAKKQFAGLALTPDGSELLVADLLDGSLAVINPDSPATTFAVPVVPAAPGVDNCEVGPLYVAAAAGNLAFVVTGSLGCVPSGTVYAVNLQTRTAAPNTPCDQGLTADSSSDGNFVAIGGFSCVYSVASSSYSFNRSFPLLATPVAISGDANVVAFNNVLADVSLNILGSVGQPIALYESNPAWAGLLLYPRLNAAGSLLFAGFPDHFEILDVTHAMLRVRFGLTETVQYTIMPMAIDAGGRNVFLITDKGLTWVDLGQALLSIGHVSQTNVTVGAQITVRGSGFDANTTATVGGVAATVVFTDENTLTLTIPAAASGPEDIVLTRGDGQIYTSENAVVLP